MLPEKLLPTTVVGSYPQPDWLVDRDVLTRGTVPRVLQQWLLARALRVAA